jgi:hypothetical protein
VAKLLIAGHKVVAAVDATPRYGQGQFTHRGGLMAKVTVASLNAELTLLAADVTRDHIQLMSLIIEMNKLKESINGKDGRLGKQEDKESCSEVGGSFVSKV